MNDWLALRAHSKPDFPALFFEGQTWDYGTLHALANQYAAQLTSYGVSIGSRVGVWLPNCPAYVALIFAVARCGAILVPLNTRLTPSELQWQIEQTACQIVITETLTDAPCVPLEIFERAPQVAFKPQYINTKKPAAILFTSGTSGFPKGVQLSWGNFFFSAVASADRIGSLPNDRWLCILPLYHVGGLSIILRACIYGITVDLHPQFDVERLNHSLTHDPITLISLVPTMLYRLLDVKKVWTPSLRLILVGGAAATPELLERADGLPIATTYGLTEATSQVATALPPQVLIKPASVGKALKYTCIEIRREDGNLTEIDEYGEITVEGSTTMQGYLNNPEATAQTLRDGWLYTGDIGYFDSEGDLWVVQRRSDLIVSGGENIYPAEVERVLAQHPAIQQVSVVGVDDAEWGQRVAAAIIPSGNVSANEIMTFARQQLASYKIPRQVLLVGELPQTASGKIDRQAVRRLFQ
jgi:o-succinylbenzoate---CoA ligase